MALINCNECNHQISENAKACPQCGSPLAHNTVIGKYEASEKKKGTAVILALILGGIGAHKFYLGHYLLGIIYLAFVWSFIPSIVAFFEAITYLQYNQKDFEEKYVAKK